MTRKTSSAERPLRSRSRIGAELPWILIAVAIALMGLLFLRVDPIFGWALLLAAAFSATVSLLLFRRAP